jgi:hypothetical protein
MRMISIRKLAAVDMALHGTRLITIEFALGVLFPLLLAHFSFRAIHSLLDALLALWLIGVAANYVPLFVYAVIISRAGTVETEGRPEVAQIRRYNTQQFILLVPFFAAMLAAVQELRKSKA